MTSIRRFFRLSWSDRRLRAEAVTLLVMVRVGLVVMPLRRLRWCLASVVDVLRIESSRELEIEAASRAVAGAARILPRTTCLAAALSLQALCELRGGAATVLIGVRKGGDAELEAHAWAEAAGVAVLGRPAEGQYRRIATFPRVRP